MTSRTKKLATGNKKKAKNDDPIAADGGVFEDKSIESLKNQKPKAAAKKGKAKKADEDKNAQAQNTRPKRAATKKPPLDKTIVDQSSDGGYLPKVNVEDKPDQRLSHLDDRVDALQEGASQFEKLTATLPKTYTLDILNEMSYSDLNFIYRATMLSKDKAWKSRQKEKQLMIDALVGETILDVDESKQKNIQNKNASNVNDLKIKLSAGFREEHKQSEASKKVKSLKTKISWITGSDSTDIEQQIFDKFYNALNLDKQTIDWPKMPRECFDAYDYAAYLELDSDQKSIFFANAQRFIKMKQKRGVEIFTDVRIYCAMKVHSWFKALLFLSNVFKRDENSDCLVKKNGDGKILRRPEFTISKSLSFTGAKDHIYAAILASFLNDEVYKSIDLSIYGKDVTANHTCDYANCVNGEHINRVSHAKNLKISKYGRQHDAVASLVELTEKVVLEHDENAIVTKMPEARIIAQPFPLNKFSGQIRAKIADAGWTEASNFAFCSEEDIFTNLNRDDSLANTVLISNSKADKFQVAGNILLPGLLKTLSNNKSMPLPIKLFELQDIVPKDSLSDTNSCNQRNAAAIYYNKAGSFKVLHELLGRIMEVLKVKFDHLGFDETNQLTYYTRAKDHSTFSPGRAAEIVLRKKDGSEVTLGVIGILHPEVLAKFELNLPCCALEINIESFH